VKSRAEAGRVRRALNREPVAEDATPLRRLDRWQAETMREELADLYVESSHAASGQGYRSRQEFLRRLAADVRRPGFAMVIAQGPTLTGCVYGFPVGRDGSWWHGYTGTLPEIIEQLTASGHVFAVAEMLIHPSESGQDFGHRLHDGLLADQDASLAATMVDRADAEACVILLSWGWTEIGEAVAIREGAKPTRLRVLVTQIDERTAQSPDGLTHDTHTQPPEGSAETR
jgi:GNAT superfamily N-acetyltransferase